MYASNFNNIHIINNKYNELINKYEFFYVIDIIDICLTNISKNPLNLVDKLNVDASNLSYNLDKLYIDLDIRLNFKYDKIQIERR